jgi:hydrogenase maturation factor
MTLVRSADAVRELLERRLEQRREAGAAFFEPEAERVARLCHRMAERFARGGRLIAVGLSPAARSDVRHVAVEFVHPVIMGKRALPAVSVDGADIVGALRLLARPGDILLVISPPDDQVTGRLLPRAEAWGLTRLWLGAGPRPPSGQAEHVIWLEGADPAVAARSGDMVMLYHLLWELTHVVFEHPGLLEPPGLIEAVACTDEVCITCSDEGLVAEVTAVGEWGQAEVVVAGRTETVDVSLVDPVGPGDLVLVHAGVALTALDDGGPQGSRS